MRIDSSTIGMESARTYRSVTARTTNSWRASGTADNKAAGNLGSLFGNLLGAEENAEETEGDESANMDLEDINSHFRALSNPSRISTGREKDVSFSIKQQCMRFLMNLFFRYRGERFSEENLEIQPIDTSSLQPMTPVRMTTTVFKNQYYHKEEECTTFSTTGMVKTADGRQIPFNLEVGMSRSFEEYYEETYSLKSVSYCDPLVINLDTNIAQVSDQKFFFDLDCDGSEEEISSLKAGSGFLALDLNGDGVINDGGELFGTKSGNGFKDLAKYDADGNGWIDEGDPIWEKLLIWTKDERGNDKLYHLSDLGVGAIGLANVSTQFALNSAQDNSNNAMIRNTGIFLYENGTVSTVQHLDLAR